MSSNRELNIIDILNYLPHRYPFLLVDRVEEIRPGHSAIGYKNVTFNEPQFMGHFPGNPIMPGVLIIEAMAQTAAALVIDGMEEEAHNKTVYFMSVEEAKFRKPVVPGDVMQIRVTKKSSRGKIWKFSAEVYVKEKLAAEATYTAMIADK